MTQEQAALTDVPYDPRDVIDARKFIFDLCDIGVISRDDRIRIMTECAGLMPQAITQAAASFVVNQRVEQRPPETRASYIIRSAQIQHDRLLEYASYIRRNA